LILLRQCVKFVISENVDFIMRNDLSISSQVFDELITALEMIGIENTIKTLQEAKTNSLILSDLDVEFIIKCVSDVTGVSKETMLYGNERNDERKIALSLCIYLIKKELDYSFSTIKKIFKKDKSALSRYNTLVEKLPSNPKTDIDKKLSTYLKKINLLITEKKIK
jgi:chromosomal replication initiation ATPase DnaA